MPQSACGGQSISVGTCSLLPLHGAWGWDSGCQAQLVAVGSLPALPLLFSWRNKVACIPGCPQSLYTVECECELLTPLPSPLRCWYAEMASVHCTLDALRWLVLSEIKPRPSLTIHKHSTNKYSPRTPSFKGMLSFVL